MDNRIVHIYQGFSNHFHILHGLGSDSLLLYNRQWPVRTGLSSRLRLCNMHFRQNQFLTLTLNLTARRGDGVQPIRLVRAYLEEEEEIHFVYTASNGL